MCPARLQDQCIILTSVIMLTCVAYAEFTLEFCLPLKQSPRKLGQHLRKMLGLKLINGHRTARYTDMGKFESIDCKGKHAEISSRANTQGYASSIGLAHLAACTRVILYRLDPADINSPYTDEYLESCCDFSGIFRALQKKRQIPKHWVDVRSVSRGLLDYKYITDLTFFPTRCCSTFKSA
jgi:hypothetical protein